MSTSVVTGEMPCWRKGVMRAMFGVIMALVLGGVSLLAQENPREDPQGILRKALFHDATLDYSYEDFLNGGRSVE